MEITRLETGTKLELEIFNDSGEKIVPAFASQLEKTIDEFTLVVLAPLFEGVVYPVHIGWNINVYFRYKNDLYKFKAKILSRTNKDDMSFLKIGVTDEIVKIQRRQFFRFECAVPMRYRVVGSLFDDEKEKTSFSNAITRDLSGGGLCMRLGEEVKVGKLIECELALDKDKKVRFYGKVVRIAEPEYDKKYKYEIGVVIKKIESKDTDAIVRFIFNEQRKLREKGLI